MPQVKKGPWDDRKWLQVEYVEKEKSTTDIAEECGVSSTLIRSRLQEHNIPRRSPGVKGKKWKDRKRYTDEDWLRSEYAKKSRPATEIANDCSVSTDTIYYWLDKHDIQTRGRGHESGEQHPCWNGGSTSPNYSSKWRQIRRRVRERDQHTCQICGYEWQRGERKLDVHHIKPIKIFDNPEEADKLENLLTLCRSCHNKWEGIPLRPQ